VEFNIARVFMMLAKKKLHKLADQTKWFITEDEKTVLVLPYVSLVNQPKITKRW
jgi:hypothetical protein